MIRGHDRGVWKGFLKGGQDLDPLDGIDAEVGVEVHGDIEHINRVARLFGDDAQHNLRDIRRTVGSSHCLRDDATGGRSTYSVLCVRHGTVGGGVDRFVRARVACRSTQEINDLTEGLDFSEMLRRDNGGLREALLQG